MINKIMQSNKINPQKKAILSLILGIISIITILGGISIFTYPVESRVYIFGILVTPPILIPIGKILYSLGGFSLVLPFLSLLTSIFGIILGRKGLNSTKKKVAIGGIVFSIIGILGLVIFILLWWGFTIEG